MTDSKLDLGALRSAVASLEDGLEVARDTGWFSQQSPKVQNTLIAGVIQNFEFVYEVGFKMLRRQIEREAASPTEVRNRQKLASLGSIFAFDDLSPTGC